MSKKLTDFDTFFYNPFLEDVRQASIIQSKDEKINKQTSLLVKDSTGKHISNAFIRENRRKFSDQRDFIRIPAEGYRIMATMEKTEIKILCYIFESIGYGELEVELSIEDVKLFYGYTSRNPIYAGIIGLIDKKVLARKTDSRSLYFLNPVYFYKGSIVTAFFDYLKNMNLRITDNSNNDLKEDQSFNKKAI
jgi:hypothetical protein